MWHMTNTRTFYQSLSPDKNGTKFSAIIITRHQHRHHHHHRHNRRHYHMTGRCDALGRAAFAWRMRIPRIPRTRAEPTRRPENNLQPHYFLKPLEPLATACIHPFVSLSPFSSTINGEWKWKWNVIFGNNIPLLGIFVTHDCSRLHITVNPVPARHLNLEPGPGATGYRKGVQLKRQRRRSVMSWNSWVSAPTGRRPYESLVLSCVTTTLPQPTPRCDNPNLKLKMLNDGLLCDWLSMHVYGGSCCCTISENDFCQLLHSIIAMARGWDSGRPWMSLRN